MNSSNVIINKVYPDNQVILPLSIRDQVYLLDVWDRSTANKILKVPDPLVWDNE